MTIVQRSFADTRRLLSASALVEVTDLNSRAFDESTISGPEFDDRNPGMFASPRGLPRASDGLEGNDARPRRDP